MTIQELIRDYYISWIEIGQHKLPDLTDCLDFMMTEVSEAIELRLRRSPYVRNNPREDIPTDREIATEVFDAIMMGCIALDLLGINLMDIANEKLERMDEKRRIPKQ